MNQTQIDKIDAHVQGLLKAVPSTFLAGGAIRAIHADEPISDYDILFTDANAQLPAQDYLTSKGYVLISATENAKTYRLAGHTTVQLVTAWIYPTIHESLASLDFTICQGALSWDTEWVFDCTASFKDDVANRLLRYTFPIRPEKAAGSLLRLFKFYKKGYSFDAFTLAGVCARAADDPSYDCVMAHNIIAAGKIPEAPKALLKAEIYHIMERKPRMDLFAGPLESASDHGGGDYGGAAPTQALVLPVAA